MENVNPKKFRAELKDYLDHAQKEPIRIQRRSGESFVLIDEKKYLEMEQETMSLQRRLLGMSEIVEGKTSEHKIGDRGRLERFKKKD